MPIIQVENDNVGIREGTDKEQGQDIHVYLSVLQPFFSILRNPESLIPSRVRYKSGVTEFSFLNAS